MKFKSLLVSLLSMAVLFFSCKQEEDLGIPRITVDPVQITLGQGEDSQAVSLTATRDWSIASKPDWVGLSTDTGKASTKPQTVNVSVNSNGGYDRGGEVVFTIGLAKAVLEVSQAGSLGELKKGSGSLDDPYTVAGVIEYVQSLGNDVNSPKQVYVKGLVSNIPKAEETFSTSGTYGNATFYISDDGGSANQFYCYRIYYLGNKRYTSGAGDDIKLGDEVVICGNVVNYKGNTPETVQSSAYLYSLNGKTGDAAPVQTEITSCSIADFIAKADVNTYYRLEGKVSNFKTGTSNAGKNYMQFDLTDGTGSIVVYGFKDGQYDAWAGKIKDGGTAVITGTYEFYASKSQHEVMNTTVESFTEGAPVQAVVGNVAQTIAAADGTPVVINEATVAAKSGYGFIAADASGVVYLYFTKDETVPSVNVGDKVKIEATKTTYGGIPEFTGAKVTALSSGSSFNYPSPKDISSVADSYASSVSEFVQLAGILSVSGNYYNIEIPAFNKSTVQGSLSSPLESLGAGSYAGQNITVKGYFIGTSKNASCDKYINILVTDIAPADPNTKYCNPSSKAIEVAADATSATLTVKANTAWEITPAGSVSVSPASGSGDATVTLSFPANATDAPVETKLHIFSAEAGLDDFIVLTQKAQGGASGDFTNTVSWTLDSNAYEQDAVVNGTKGVTVLKLGTGSKYGSATISLPAPASKLEFYAISWNAAPADLVFKVGGKEVAKVSPAANTGLKGQPTYTLTVADSDFYTIDLGASVTTLTVETQGGYRAALFGVKSK